MAAKILIVDNVATNRIVLKVRLAAACYETVQATTAAAALEAVAAVLPDVVLLDAKLPDRDGIDLCRELKSAPATRHVPIIMMTSRNDTRARTGALRAGADDFLTKPLDDATLLARLRSVLRARQTEEELRLRELTGREMGLAEAASEFERPTAGGHVALVTARPETAMTLRRALRSLGCDALSGVSITALTKAEALSGAGPAEETDVFLIEARLEGADDGLRLISELRSRPATRHAAICIIVPEQDSETAVMALDLGAADLVTEDADPMEMGLRLATQIRRKRHADRLRDTMRNDLRLALTDPLTGLYNRRYALPHLDRIAERARETGRRYAVMVLDIDRFKSVNDTFGHAAGDAVLAELAHRLADNLRAVDLLARIGGEEFLIAMPDTNLGTARLVAERICRVAHERSFDLPGGRKLSVTLSIGLAMGGGEDGAGDAPAVSVMGRADRALLNAKAEGRNQVTVGLSPAA